jgi:hypothetical protein
MCDAIADTASPQAVWRYKLPQPIHFQALLLAVSTMAPGVPCIKAEFPVWHDFTRHGQSLVHWEAAWAVHQGSKGTAAEQSITQ